MLPAIGARTARSSSELKLSRIAEHLRLLVLNSVSFCKVYEECCDRWLNSLGVVCGAFAEKRLFKPFQDIASN